jgi:hypothetical protein
MISALIANLRRKILIFAITLPSCAISIQAAHAAQVAQSSSGRLGALKIANLIKNRTTKFCNGSLLSYSYDYITELKDVSSLKENVIFQPPTQLERLNQPDYKGRYIIQYMAFPNPTFIRRRTTWVPSEFDNGYGEASQESYTPQELASWLQRSNVSLWEKRPATQAKPLVVTVVHWDQGYAVERVNFGRRAEFYSGPNSAPIQSNQQFIPDMTWIKFASFEKTRAREQRARGFWNEVANLNEGDLFPQDCFTYINPTKVAATAFLIKDDRLLSENIRTKYVGDDQFYDDDVFMSQLWTDVVYMNVGAYFAVSSKKVLKILAPRPPAQ